MKKYLFISAGIVLLALTVHAAPTSPPKPPIVTIPQQIGSLSGDMCADGGAYATVFYNTTDFGDASSAKYIRNFDASTHW